MNPHGALLLLAATLVGADGPIPDAVKQELERLQGIWQTVSVEIDGEPIRQSVRADRLTIKGTTFVLTTRTETMGGILRIDPTKRPRTIDTETVLGENKGVKAVGIYLLDGDTLRVCYAPAPRPRPTAFRTAPKSGHALVVYKRVKK